jgi:nucleoside-diphosphate-sugar epimerase
MGRYLVETLLQQNHQVTILNRGNKYWGVRTVEDDPDDLVRILMLKNSLFQFQQTRNPFGDRVRKVIVDRDEAEDCVAALRKETAAVGGRWDVVVDFSAFYAEDIDV